MRFGGEVTSVLILNLIEISIGHAGRDVEAVE